MTSFGADEIRIGEVLYRSEAHVRASIELFAIGRKPDALLQAARPITDLLPSLETELRSAEEPFREFFSMTAAVGAEIRRNVRARSLRRRMKAITAARGRLVEAAVGEPAAGGGYRASVAIALLDGVAPRYRRAVTDGDLGEYHAAYAMAEAATGLLHDAGVERTERAARLMPSLHSTFPAIEPPAQLTQPDDVDKLVDELGDAVIQELDALRVSWTLKDSLGRIDRLLGDVLVSYEQGLGPLSARLAASLFVRSYDPIRHDLGAVAPDAEARLTSLLGFELRTAINEGAEPERVRALATEAHELLVSTAS